jgi:phosphoglycerate-specific signal transduction histidine kinase
VCSPAFATRFAPAATHTRSNTGSSVRTATCWIFGRGRVIRDGDGQPIRYSGVDLDITERKATEEALDAARFELERMNRSEQRVRDRTADLEAEAARRIEAESRLNQAQKMEAVGS